MAASIKDKYDVEPELIQGSGGIFDVAVDGQLIYSKHQTGRFPEHQEIFQKLDAVRA